MAKFKSIYKSEYNKIVNNYDENLEDEKTYTFNSNVDRRFTRTQATFSSRTRNKNERFENELLCKE